MESSFEVFHKNLVVRIFSENFFGAKKNDFWHGGRDASPVVNQWRLISMSVDNMHDQK